MKTEGEPAGNILSRPSIYVSRPEMRIPSAAGLEVSMYRQEKMDYTRAGSSMPSFNPIRLILAGRDR